MNVASMVGLLATISWIALFFVFFVTIARATRRQPSSALTTVVIALAVIAIVLTTVSAGLVFVQPDERGVVISAVEAKGYRELALEPGLRWIMPYFETVVFYSISRQTYTMSGTVLEGQVQGDDSIAARTADGQEIFVDASVIFAIDPQKVVQVHIEWQDRYTEGLVRPLARGVIRDAVSQFGVEEIVTTKRAEMIAMINEVMRKKLEANGLLLIDFVLRNITFSPEYAASVEQKQVAEQMAQQARFVVEQKKQEAEQARQVAQGQADAAVIKAQGEADARLIQAQAEAEALRLLAAALKENPELLTYQYINQLAPGIRVMLVPNDNPYLLPLPSLDQGTILPTPAKPITP